MLKGRDTIGKPIIAYETGEKVAQVRDLIFDYRRNRVLGFLVIEKGWLRKGEAVAVEAVRSIGPDSIIITDKAAIVDLAELPELQAVIEDDKALIHAKIMTTDGQNLGTILDLYFEDETWSVVGYEASGGLFVDIYSGRAFIPAPQTIEIGKDYAFVNPEVAEKMKEHTGGLEAQLQAMGKQAQAAAAAAGDQWQELSEATAEQLQKTRSTAQETLKSTRAAMDKKTQTLLPQPTLEHTQGRRVRQEVRTPDGQLIAAPGLIVTEPVMAEAQRYGLEDELIAAVGLTPSETIGAEAKGRLQKTQAQLRQGTHQLQEGLQHLWQQTTDQVSHLRENRVHAHEESRIQSALGRHVNRTILDAADNVILNEGELITHGAIERARQADVLETLLDSVDKRQSRQTAASPEQRP